MKSLFFAGVFAFAALPAWTQDTRQVSEPVIPHACTALAAQLQASGKSLAAADEQKPDTVRIQSALDHCAAGQAVELKPDGARNAFLAGPMQLRAGVTLLVDAGVTLFASRNPRDYDLSPGSCGTVTPRGHGCRPLIAVNNVAGAGVMGEGTIDGRGGATLLGQPVTWWDLAQEAKVKNLNQSCPRILVATKADNFTLYRIRLENSPNFHVSYSGGNGFTAWGVIINTGKEGRNTDGIDPGNSTNVTITHCYIRAGDDNVAIKAGAGAPTTHMTIAHNHFYYGHGMSIGSETDGGAGAIRVTDLSIDGADNGIRIKSNSSRGGLVHDVVYDDVCIRDTKNPIFMDTNYSYRGAAIDKIPVFQDIVLRNVRIDGAGKITLDGFDRAHRLEMIFDNVYFSDPSRQKVEARHAGLSFGPGPVNIQVSGDDVQVTATARSAPPNACENKFVPLPLPGEKR
jgi:polygalacturonase